jgi:hypothetical protein
MKFFTRKPRVPEDGTHAELCPVVNASLSVCRCHCERCYDSSDPNGCVCETCPCHGAKR